MRIKFNSYLMLFILIWVINGIEIKAGGRYVAPVEAVPYPTGAGKVYAQGGKGYETGLVAKYPGADKGWSTSERSFNGTFDAWCVPVDGWFFIGWTEDSPWSEGSTFISTEVGSSDAKIRLSNDVPSYSVPNVSSGTWNDNVQGKECVAWMNDNKEKCKFCYGNFARVIASTDSEDGETSYSPLVNKDGDVVTLTAVVTNEASHFSHWALNGTNVSTSPTYSFTVSSSNYGNYKAVFETIGYPDDGTYIFKNVGTNHYASCGGDPLAPNAMRDKDFCTTYTVDINDQGGIAAFTTGGTDLYSYRSDFISYLNDVLTSLGVDNPDATDFVTNSSTIYLEAHVGGYAAFHQIPTLSSNVSSVTDWNAIKARIIETVHTSNLNTAEQRFLLKVVNIIEPNGKYYITASEDGTNIYYTTDGPTDYALWNQETTSATYISNANGWCHLKNTGTGGYAGFIGNEFNQSSNPDFSNLATMLSAEDAISSPCDIFFVKNTGNQSDLYAQGYGIRNQNDYLTFMTNEIDGSLIISAWNTVFLYADGNELKGTTNQNQENMYWTLEPLTESTMDKYYFGAKCNAKFTDGKGHYYTTMFTCFPYKCMDGIKAYYLKSDGVDLDNKRIVCTEIESGKVPANTAVILECNGLTPKENRLLPINCSYNYNTNELTCSDESVGTITDNILTGTYFNHGENHIPYTRNSDGSVRYLVFSISDGLLGFYKHNTMQYLSANKAYLDMNKLESAGIKDLNGYTLAFESSGETTNIENLSDVSNSQNSHILGVYNIMGVKVADKIEGSNLPKGVYIINGKKFIVR